MPVVLFTFHAYRSWTEDNERGYVQRGKPGVQPPNKRLARHRAKIAKAAPTRFDENQKRVLIESARELCETFNLRLHAGAVTPTHAHLLISWKDMGTPAADITTLLKRKLGNRLSRHKGTNGNRWFSRGGDEEPVIERGHFDHLCNTYLPDHIDQRGVFWREGLYDPQTHR